MEDIIRTGLYIAAILVPYWIVVKTLSTSGILERYNITAYGPVLMIRTKRGQTLLDRLAIVPTFWRAYASTGVFLMVVGMGAMTLILIAYDIMFLQSPPQPSTLNEPRNVLLIPGINEFIPLGFGIIALFVALVVHELSHAVLCRVEGVRVKSMGLLTLIVPIGGFAEPDESQLFGNKEEKEEDDEREEDNGVTEEKEVVGRGARIRILTAGVMSNFVVAAIAFMIFFAALGALVPASNQTVIASVEEGSPADLVGINEGVLVTIDGKEVNVAEDAFTILKGVHAGDEVVISVLEKGKIKSYTLIARSPSKVTGVMITEVSKGSAADRAGIPAGTVITGIDDVTFHNATEFISFMGTTHAGQHVVVHTGAGDYEVELGRGDGKGYLGVYIAGEDLVSEMLGMVIADFPANDYLNMLRSIPSQLDTIGGWFLLIAMPLMGGLGGMGFSGFTGALSDLYDVTGVPIPEGVYLWLLSVMFWIGWINFNVALFNCLPAVPLDGGHVFRDLLSDLLERFTYPKKAERLAGMGVMVLAYIIFTTIALMVVGPYFVG
ncbi:MAG: site-2 protease family protein [Methermicoccaceae archaeon]